MHYRGLDKYHYQIGLSYKRYMILYMYQEDGTMILVVVQAVAVE